MNDLAMAAGLVFALVLAGCASPVSPEDEVPSGASDASPATAPDASAWEPCVHPWPCGDGSEWPTDLDGPFDVAQVVDVSVETSAGLLDGWALLPDVPEGTRVPVVLEATPYPGQCGFFNLPRVNCRFHANTPLWDVDDDSVEAPFFLPLVKAGYAFVTVNLPGTGASEGCFDDYGPATQQALADLVEGLGEKPWSNGRVGMLGLSASGTTPFAAAIKNPPSLKTIMPLGVQSNLYTFSATPQGALAAEGFFHTRYAMSVSLTPPPTGDPGELPTMPARHTQRICPDVVDYAAQNQRTATAERDLAFWEPRMLILDFPQVTTSVMTVHGFGDAFGSGHAEQDDDIWHALTGAPQRMILGQWGHEYPVGALLESYHGGDDWWSDVVIPWLDFWLKGIGDHPPRLGYVDYQDASNAWHETTAWPPTEATDKALFLSARTLANISSETATSFQAGRNEDNPREVHCGGTTPLGPMGTSFVSRPAHPHSTAVNLATPSPFPWARRRARS